MRLTDIVLLGLAVIAAGLSLGLAALLTRSRIALASARAERDRATIAEAAMTRVLRLSVTDLRADAMRLLGHAEKMNLQMPEPSADMTGVLAAIRQILELADDMQDHAVPGASTRRLELETLDLQPLLADAIEAVTATLGPSERHWRIARAVRECGLITDRRAMAQVLGRVLGNAARHSRHGDWIDISVERHGRGLTLIVEDEGAGLMAVQRTTPSDAPNSRGLGLGLVLARVLMEAQGGYLTVESTARVGTKVSLGFPPDRVSSADKATVVKFAA